MKILITGANGFLGKNLIAKLNECQGKYDIYKIDVDTSRRELEKYVKDCDFVFNFAAVHRPKDTNEFDRINHLFFDELLELLKKNNNICPVLYTSSIQATNGTEYGNSKLKAEDDLRKYSEQTGARGIIYRLSNIYGRWATPNHHSVVATFCNNLSLGLPIQITDRAHVMNFHYVDDVIDSFVKQLEGTETADEDGLYRIKKLHTLTLGELADTLIEFCQCAKQSIKPTLKNETQKTLYKTFISYYENAKKLEEK